MAEKILRILNRILDAVILIVLLLAGLYSVYSIWDNSQIYQQSLQLQVKLKDLKPQEEKPSFEKLLQINPDVVAWVTLEGTQIDHPIVQGKDNLEYLNKDVYGDYALSGSIFLDARCRSDFQDNYLLLYGHHMEKHQMFGDLEDYLQESFFSAHQTGTLMIPGETYDLQIFAVATFDGSDTYIFDPEKASEDQAAVLEYIRKHATCKRDSEIEEIRENGGKILALSTCSTDRLSDRTVLLAKMTQRNNKGADQT
jgi:sortase B